MNRTNIIYHYDTTNHCHFDKTTNNSAMNASCDVYICDNPITFINNQRQIYMDSVTVTNMIWKRFELRIMLRMCRWLLCINDQCKLYQL